MKVVQLLPELNEGGVERGVVELNRELVRRGIESIVISSGGKQTRKIAADGGRHLLFDVASKNPFSAPGRIRSLKTMLEEIAPDIIHARSRVPAWLAYLANQKQHCPFVTTVHGFNSVNQYSRVMTFGDRVICVSGAIRDYVVEHYAVPQEKLVIIPRGVDLDQFDPQHLDQSFMDEFIARYDLNGKFIVTSVGRITQLKDYETLISALVLIKQSVPTLVGLIVGGVHEDKKDYFAKLQQQVAEQDAGDYIHFCGSQEKVQEIYSLSHVVVSSSKKPESFGRSAAEALAMGAPVIATNHGGILDIVIDGKTGFLTRVGDIEQLAGKIIEARDAGFVGLREHVIENFSLTQMVEKTINVYEELSL